MQKPKILDRKICAQSKLFTIEQLELEFSNGVKTTYERLKGSGRGAVLVIAIRDDHHALLIREYAAGVDRYELALPKGKIDGDETIEEAANRELMEETGFGARKLTHINAMTIAPGYLSHVTHIVLAQDLYPKKLEGDEPEEIEVVPWSLDNLTELFAQEDMTEARSIAALYQVRDLLKPA